LLLLSNGRSLSNDIKERNTFLSEIVKDELRTVTQTLDLLNVAKLNLRLIEYGVPPLVWAAQKGYLHAVELLLLKDGIDPDAKDLFGQTPLLLAAANGQESVVDLLLAKSAVDPNVKDTHSLYGQTPLAWAAKNGHESVVKLLMANSHVELESMDNSGRTPLALAKENGHVSVCSLLSSPR